MAEIRRATLFGKLNPIAYKAIESATVFCKMRGNPYVETVHWLHQLLQSQDTDARRIIKHFQLDPSRVAADLIAALDKLPRGATAISDFSPDITNVVERAWVYGSLMFGEFQVRTGHIIVGFLNSELKHKFLAISREFNKFKLEELTDNFAKITAGSPEEGLRASDGSGMSAGAAPGDAGGTPASASLGKQEALARFAVDLTEKARKGELDPIVGRDEEIRQVVDILMRRRQNNPILTGEAGVGKTAVVEGFALRIVAGDVPPALKDVTLRTLDIGLLQAGASMKGEFEQRLRQVIEEVQQSPKPIILFIDEAHTLIGAGGAAGTGDAANLLKPALARGTLRTVAATTWDEYKKHFEKDPALTRRFQVVKVEEPSEIKAILMMRSIVPPLEKHHKVLILDEAIESAVRLSHRYIPARQLPDKSVSLIDTACARVAVSQHAVPAEVDDSRRRIQALETEQEILKRETSVGMDHAARLAELEQKLSKERTDLKALENHWAEEKAQVAKILELRARLRSAGSEVDSKPTEMKPGMAANPKDALTTEQRDALLAELKTAQDKLAKFQGESPLMFPSVDQNAIASVVADWTGIPVGRMVRNEIEQVLKLADHLERRVIGQRHALESIARRIQTSRARLDNPNHPVGVFMLAGPSGTGKTETALTLAETLYGGEHNLITINMSEFQEAHTVSTLKGSPPGYVGYGEGGVLTEAVRRRPYSVVLLDEVEKAHPDVLELFFQVFDKGHMEDGEGRQIDFKNTIIILTSNTGTSSIMKYCEDPNDVPDWEELVAALKPELNEVFKPAFLGRLVTIPYFPIHDEALKKIIQLKLAKIQKRLVETHRVELTFSDEFVDEVANRCTEVESGARNVDNILTNTLLPDISKLMLTRIGEGQNLEGIHVGLSDDGSFVYGAL